MQLLESGEMYLETLYLLRKKNSEVRAIDIANRLGYSRPSVSRAVALLKDSGHIVVDSRGLIEFTEKGEAEAIAIYEKHCILTEFFVSLGVNKDVAEIDACKIEHIISEDTFEALKTFINKK